MKFIERVFNLFILFILLIGKQAYECYINGVPVSYAYSRQALTVPLLIVFLFYVGGEMIVWYKEQEKKLV